MMCKPRFFHRILKEKRAGSCKILSLLKQMSCLLQQSLNQRFGAYLLGNVSEPQPFDDCAGEGTLETAVLSAPAQRLPLADGGGVVGKT
jgi:hypothetical protein